jgi:hypothetical protein
MSFESIVRCQEQVSKADGSEDVPEFFQLRSAEAQQTMGILSKTLQRFSDDRFGACFGEPLPRGAVAVKLTWAPVGANTSKGGVQVLANYDTSAVGMTAMIAKSGTWRIADQDESRGRSRTIPVPGLDGIYRVRLDNGDEWALTGIHATTRETKEWVWLSWWWGGDQPDTDFGSDRPDLCSAGDQSCGKRSKILERWYAPWSRYKMCSVTAWREGDPVMNSTTDAGFQKAASDAGWTPGLRKVAEATRAVYSPTRKANDGRFFTWCSNPFIEFEPGMADSNCIGCHQHSAPGGSYSQADHNSFDKSLKDFPADFLWSFDNGVDFVAGRIYSIFKSE